MNSRQKYFAETSMLKLMMHDGQPIVTNSPQPSKKSSVKNITITIFMLLALFDTIAAFISWITYQSMQMTGMLVITGLLLIIIALVIKVTN